MENQHHSREEVTEAVSKLMAKEPGGFLWSEEKEFICDLLERGDSQEEGEYDGLRNAEEGFESEWAPKEEVSDVSLYVCKGMKTLEKILEN